MLALALVPRRRRVRPAGRIGSVWLFHWSPQMSFSAVDRPVGPIWTPKQAALTRSNLTKYCRRLITSADSAPSQRLRGAANLPAANLGGLLNFPAEIFCIWPRALPCCRLYHASYRRKQVR